MFSIINCYSVTMKGLPTAMNNVAKQLESTIVVLLY